MDRQCVWGVCGGRGVLAGEKTGALMRSVAVASTAVRAVDHTESWHLDWVVSSARPTSNLLVLSLRDLPRKATTETVCGAGFRLQPGSSL